MESGEVVVEEAKRRCKALKNRISTLSTTTQSSWKTTLLRLINSELSFLNRVNNSPLKLSTNIGYLESVVHILQHPLITSVSRVCKPISISSKVPQQSIYVDIICSFNGNPVWFIVSDRNPRYISWQDSEKTKNNKGLRNRISQLLFAASESCATVRPCSIILFFSNGLQNCIIEKLKDEFGATTDLGFGFSDFDCEFVDELEEDGDWVSVLGRSFEKACVLEIKIGSFSSSNKDGQTLTDQSGNSEKVHIKDVSYDVNLGGSFIALVSALRSWSPSDVEDAELVNFDTTALVAIVSGISNGGIDRILATPESELRSRFKGNYEFMIGQVKSLC
ncbi:PREDICTED: uncharacterized protein LOC109211614 [Nicotiana attenuata]|uniref:DUF1308 domain-containing protein n=1 Tax=Nicotiana attenuata TaxID=49451 RepID=A0A314KIN7_NICAT|nr:PREDICTED: uncharacterized protein LOC109211614 [Nicotiana attenuata]OIT29236.1 hypothetical protein A4A49_32711 [Nicotiana attenuata]